MKHYKESCFFHDTVKNATHVCTIKEGRAYRTFDECPEECGCYISKKIVSKAVKDVVRKRPKDLIERD